MAQDAVEQAPASRAKAKPKKRASGAPKAAKQQPNGRKAPVDRVERWALSRLVPYARNPRLHSPEQVDQIAASMTEFGQAQLIVVDEKGEIVAGHGRVLAAEALGWKDVMVGVAVGWSEEQRRAYRIADNKIALSSSWDMELLSGELQSLRTDDFDLALVGFSDLELGDIFALPGTEEQGNEQPQRSSANQKKINTAWGLLLGEWREMLGASESRGWVSPSYSKAALKVWFLRALVDGATIPRPATLAYTPHRLFINGDKKGSLFDMLGAIRDNENSLGHLATLLAHEPRLDRLLSMTPPVNAFRIPNDFPIELACSLIEEFCPPGGKVLDPCHGWGGRLIGFLLSKASHYHGFDVDPRTGAGVSSMFDDLKDLAKGKKTGRFDLVPFEDSKLPAKHFDFAFTSPPYFNVEKYEGEQQSYIRYKTFEVWAEKFYRPMLQKVSKALKPAGVFVLQVGLQRFDFKKLTASIAPDVGLVISDIRSSGMVNSRQQTDPEEGEIIIVLRKEENAAVSQDKTLVVGDPAARYGTVLQ